MIHMFSGKDDLQVNKLVVETENLRGASASYDCKDIKLASSGVPCVVGWLLIVPSMLGSTGGSDMQAGEGLSQETNGWQDNQETHQEGFLNYQDNYKKSWVGG